MVTTTWVSGITKFLSTYKKIVTSSVAPSSTLAQAFHSFGKIDSKFTYLEYIVTILIHYGYSYLCLGLVRGRPRRGRYIRVNSGGIQRRRKELCRGSKMAPQGRPPLKRKGAQMLPMPPKRPKKPQPKHGSANSTTYFIILVPHTLHVI